MDDLLEEERQVIEGESEEENTRAFVESVKQHFEQMDRTDRVTLLVALLTIYCPECGDSHDTCKCEEGFSMTETVFEA